MRVLVTGGLGYVGGRTAAHLARQGHTVFILSRRGAARPGKADMPPDQTLERGQPDLTPDPGQPDIGAPYTLVSADLEQAGAEELTALLPPDLDGVVHAASLNEAFLPDYPRRALLINSWGTRVLLEALQRSAAPGRDLPLLIYCSTFHVYGRSEGLIDENCPAMPANDYALTHFFAEEYCRSAMRHGGPPAVIVRLTNGYGLASTPESQKWHLLINDLCRSAVEKGELIIRSDPSVQRDFVWLGDMARAVEALLQRRDLAGRVFNIASGESLSLGEVARRVALAAEEVLGRAVPLRREREPGPERPRLEVGNAAVRQALGFHFHDRLHEEAVAIIRSLV